MLQERLIRNNRIRPRFVSPGVVPGFRRPNQRPIPVVYQPRKPRGILNRPQNITRQRCLTISSFLTISAEVLNLAEQFVVFAQIRDNSSSDFQFRFLLMVTAIAFCNLVKYIFSSRRIRIIISIGIDSAEFATYYALLQRKTSLFIVTAIFYPAEVVLHLINLFTTGETIERKTNLKKIIDLFVQTFLFFFSNTIPFMTLFMKDRTEFRKDYFEYLLILYIFIGNAGIEVVSEIVTRHVFFLLRRLKGRERPSFYDISNDEDFVLQIYLWVKFGISIAINFLTMPILIFVISIIQLSKYGDTLPRYDRNCYIIFISFISTYFFLLPFLIWLVFRFVKFCLRDRDAEH